MPNGGNQHPAANAHPAYRPDIDGLRALAVLAVVGFHAGLPWIPGGFIGVDVFFVISGYLISTIIFQSLERGSFSFFDFYAKRVRRIFPALILVLSATAILGWFLLTVEDYAELGKNILAGALFFSNFELWKESGYFDSAAELKPLLHLWSLGVEEQFYIVWPPLIFLAWKRKANVFWVIAIIAFASFGLNVARIEAHASSTFYLLPTRAWELMAGSLLAFSELRKIRFFSGAAIWQNFAALFGLLLAGAATLFLSKEMAFPGWWAALPVLGTFLLIAAGPEAWINRTLLSHRYCVAIGLFSYPLYLWHWPLIVFSRIAQPSGANPYLTPAAIALSFVLAIATYRYVEKNARIGFSKNRPVFLYLIISMMLVVALVGASIYKMDGFIYRYPQLAQLSKFSTAHHDASWRRSSCFFLPEDSTDEVEAFEKNKCAMREQGKPLVLLVGDSHAAALYPGLASTLGDHVTLGQLTSGNCVPMIENVQHLNNKDATPRCHKINNYVFRKIHELNPDILIIGGNYYAYEEPGGWSYPNYLSLAEENINALARSGIKHIIVIGQTPTWSSNLPKIIERFLVQNEVVPERLKTDRADNAFEIEKKLAGFSWAWNVTYVSLIDNLCDTNGCRVQIGPKFPDDVSAIDTGHLSESGSAYVTKQMIAPIIASLLKH